MKNYIIPQGWHPAWPFLFTIKRKPHRVTWRVRFEQPAYDLGDADQMDWNKLFGISFHLFTNHENSFMLGWRWNETLSVIELCIYTHRGGETIYTPPVAHLRDGEVLECELLIDYKEREARAVISIDGQEVDTWIIGYPKRLRSWTREINTWFGGNRTAPVQILLEKETTYG